MRIRDLFAGCSAMLFSLSEKWIVQLQRVDGAMQVLGIYEELPDAIESVHAAALMLVDDTELVPDVAIAKQTHERLREMLARQTMGELPPATDELQASADERLRHWFIREMQAE